jgi:hypothetical protein
MSYEFGVIICIQCGDRALGRTSHSDICMECRYANTNDFISWSATKETQKHLEKIEKLELQLEKFNEIKQIFGCPYCDKLLRSTESKKRHMEICKKKGEE